MTLREKARCALWSAVAERSGDTAFGWHERNKGVSRFACHRTPSSVLSMNRIGTV